jgi:hypothetical protein
MPPDIAEPEFVYHYTTMNAMMKMAESASIWATSIGYLNDTTEGEHFLKLIRDRLPKYRESHTLKDSTIFDKFLSERTPGFEGRPFVASFSREPDSLPQWRSYCPNGNGISVGFRVECLKRAFVELKNDPGVSVGHHVTFEPVKYIDNSDSPPIDDDIESIIEVSTLLAERPGRDPGGMSAAAFFKYLIEREACFKKHPSFSNEREYRLVLDPVHWHYERLEFRSTRSTLVPYIPVSIPREHSSRTGLTMSRSPSTLYSPLEGRWQFIDNVVIGPTTNMTLSLQAVESFFKKHSMHVKVEPSSVPFRDW